MMAKLTNPSDVPARLFEGQVDDSIVEQLPQGGCRLTLTLDLRNGSFLRVASAEDNENGFEPFRTSMEICWSPLDRMAETAQTIRDALAQSEGATVNTGDDA